ncbi:hypothetical protein M5689_002580 [Euphorbia peplus]|nr:hypothetical protein M5689_002580 [Euphorbia peplus]
MVPIARSPPALKARTLSKLERNLVGTILLVKVSVAKSRLLLETLRISHRTVIPVSSRINPLNDTRVEG